MLKNDFKHINKINNRKFDNQEQIAHFLEKSPFLGEFMMFGFEKMFVNHNSMNSGNIKINSISEYSLWIAFVHKFLKKMNKKMLNNILINYDTKKILDKNNILITGIDLDIIKKLVATVIRDELDNKIEYVWFVVDKISVNFEDLKNNESVELFLDKVKNKGLEIFNILQLGFLERKV